jgi:hypothetical protein
VSPKDNPGFVRWAVLGLTIVAAGAVLAALLAVGPIAASRASVSILLAAPVSRRAVLTRRWVLLVIVMAAAGAVLGLVAAAVAGTLGVAGYLAAGAAGAAAGLVLAAGAVLLQERSARSWWPAAVVGIGLAVLAIAAIAGLGTSTLPGPPAVLPWAAAVLAVLAPAMTVVATGSLGRLRGRDLATGGDLLTAARAGVSFLDLSLLGGVLTERRARRIAAVRFRPLPDSRTAALIAADVRRLIRFRGAWALAAGLLAVPYAAALLLPPAAVGPAATAAAAAVATAGAGGLRTVARSPALARALGGSDRGLRSAHLVVPTVFVGCWVALTVPAIGGVHAPVALLSWVAAVCYARVQAPMPRPDFTSPVTDFGFGAIQPQLVGSLAKGLLLLAAAGAVQVLLVRAGW